MKAMKLYVGHLPQEASDAELRNWFLREGFGVDRAKIIRDRYSGKPRGFGFVEIGDNEEAVRAILILNGKEFQGRTLVVDEARPARPPGRALRPKYRDTGSPEDLRR